MGKSCAKCDKEFKPGESQLSAMGKLWHKTCFVCAKCGKPFSAGSIVIEDGKPVHEECDSAAAAPKKKGGQSKGACAGCKQEFKPGESILTAMDKPWHQGCFKCAKCKKPFTGGSIVLEKGKPMHEDCSKEQFDDDNGTCDICGESLSNGGPILQLSDQSQYHQSCFKCNVCGKPFDKKSPYHVKVNGKPCHNKCVDVHDDVTESVIKNKSKGCTKCGKEIDGPVKVVPDVGSYHPECFVCDTCGCELSGRYSIHPKTEKPNCKDCVGKFTAKWDRNKEDREAKVNSMECTKCGKMIEGKPKKVPDVGNFHKECFVCDTCGCELKKKYFVHPKTRMPNCKPCLEQYKKDFEEKQKNQKYWRESTKIELSQPFEITRNNNDCIKCGKATDPDTAKKVDGLGSWHPECFSCDTCGCTINRKYGIHPETNLPNCKPCLEKYDG